MYAYFNGLTSVQFVIVEPFTNAREDSSLGDNSKVSVATAAENVEVQNIKRRAHFSPFSKAMLHSKMSTGYPYDYKRLSADSALLILYLIHPFLLKLHAQKQSTTYLH